ncbi:MAG: hypothetical protein CMP23_09815 [Rickettsiales bacterium]|nr:hypothetical protein [Rickettsiales bacterium]
MQEALPPNLSHIHAAVIEAWPEHLAVLQKSIAAFPPEQLLQLDGIADQVLRLVGSDMDRYIEGYRWISRMQLEEELHFRRTGDYRNSTFEQAWEQVYSKPELMGLYMDGLLVSQVLWSNHAQTLLSFTEDFLPRLRPGARILEVGPGHGLGCALAATHSGNFQVEAWDLSDASLRRTQQHLEQLDLADRVTLHQRDATIRLEAGMERFDALVISEVLEHVERPVELLASLAQHLTGEGLLFAGVPANSPAPDHLYLLRDPDEALTLVEDAGFELVAHHFHPCTGYTLERARKVKATVSCVVIGRRGSAGTPT